MHKKVLTAFPHVYFRALKGHSDDVSRFVVKDSLIVSGGRDATLVGWRAETGEFLFAKRYCHGGEVSAVDTAIRNRLVLTGSRDKMVKVWSLHSMDQQNSAVSPSPELAFSIDLGDRIWSLACDPSGSRAIIGSAGLGGIPALHIMDLQTLREPEAFGGEVLKKGAGMLDIQWLDDNTFLSCGYDTYARMWDVRANACVRAWEEPFDEAVYCFSTDNAFTLVCGMARHGLVRLWDMRASGSGPGPAPAGRKKQQHISMFYARHAKPRQSSPVYSVAFDQANLYVALDQCLNLLSFSGDGSRTNNQLVAQPCRQQFQQQQQRQRHFHQRQHHQRPRARRH
jgi:F-box/WD-40 domain protein 4